MKDCAPLFDALAEVRATTQPKSAAQASRLINEADSQAREASSSQPTGKEKMHVELYGQSDSDDEQIVKYDLDYQTRVIEELKQVEDAGKVHDRCGTCFRLTKDLHCPLHVCSRYCRLELFCVS